MKVTALLKSTVGDITISTADPIGRPITFHFNKDNSFQVEVPTEMTYKTFSGKTEVFQTNYAQHLLDAVKVTHGERKGSQVFELVEQVSHPVVVESVKVTDKTKMKAKGEKEKKNENQDVSQ